MTLMCPQTGPEMSLPGFVVVVVLVATADLAASAAETLR